jgi:hypothetical protein
MKKGFELSISFLIGIILGIVMLILGLLFAYKLINGANTLVTIGVPDQIELEAQTCVQRSDKVCVPEIKKQIITTRTDRFWVIINNIYGQRKDFKVFVKFSRGILDDGSEISSLDVSKWTFVDYSIHTIENNDHFVEQVVMQPPRSTKKGSYIFNIYVCSKTPQAVDDTGCKAPFSSLYGTLNQITVEVP